MVVLIAATVIAYPRCRLWWQIRSGHRALLTGHPQIALQVLTKAVEFAPEVAEVQYRLAVAERRCGHLDRVSSRLQEARKLGWLKEDIERQALLALAQSGDVDTVDSPLKAIMRRGASDEAAEEIYEALAIGFLKTYRLKEAWECLTFWIEWRPKALFPKFWRADICHRIDSPMAEEQEYRAILEIDPGNTAARAKLAEVLKDSNRTETAAKEFEKCIDQKESSPDVLIGLAECRRRLGDTASSIQLLQQALRMPLSPMQRCSALTDWGQIDADSGQFKEAIAHFEEAVRLAPYAGSTVFMLSQAYAAIGDATRAKELKERSEFIRRQHERVEAIASSLLKQPGGADLRYEAGKILIELGMKEEGRAWLRTALQMQPNHSGALQALRGAESGNSDRSTQ